MVMALPCLWPRLLCAVATTLLVDVRLVWAEPSINSNTTLLFRSVSHGNSVRSCSCAQTVSACDEALANLLCSCHTLLTPTGQQRNYTSHTSLSVWVRDPWLLWECLSGAEVGDLRVCVCAPLPPPPPSSPPLLLLGLRRLQLLFSTSGHQGELWRQSPQSLLLQPPPSNMAAAAAKPHLVLLDADALRGESALRAYSVIASDLHAHTHTHSHTHTLTHLHTLMQHFQQLTLPQTLTHTPHTLDTQQPRLLTFVY